MTLCHQIHGQQARSREAKLKSHSKVRIVLEELEIPYTNELLSFAELKKEPYVSINPNGRVPAIQDPNTGITLWEVSWFDNPCLY